MNCITLEKEIGKRKKDNLKAGHEGVIKTYYFNDPWGKAEGVRGVWKSFLSFRVL